MDQEWRYDPDPPYARGLRDYSVEANMKDPHVHYLMEEHHDRAKYFEENSWTSWNHKLWLSPF